MVARGIEEPVLRVFGTAENHVLVAGCRAFLIVVVVSVALRQTKCNTAVLHVGGGHFGGIDIDREAVGGLISGVDLVEYVAPGVDLGLCRNIGGSCGADAP